MEVFDPVIQNELAPQETLLWTGRPPFGLRLSANDAYFIPFSILWGGFTIFWETMAVVTHAPFFFKLWGVPFVLVGLYLMIGRFFVDAFVRERTVYGITSARIIIVSEVFARKVKSLNIRTLTEITFTQRKNGGASIIFGPTHAVGRRSTWPGSGAYGTPSFELAEEGRAVYEIIQALHVERQGQNGEASPNDVPDNETR